MHPLLYFFTNKIFLENTYSKSSCVQSNASFQAIVDALRMVFASTPNEAEKKSKKRTQVKRPFGQVMTEERVIKQLENNKKRTTKNSNATNTTYKSRKRRNSRSHGMLLFLVVFDRLAFRNAIL